METIAQKTRHAAQSLASLDTVARNEACEAIAVALQNSTQAILAANQEDLTIAKTQGISEALYGRLKLGESKLEAAIAGVRQVAQLEDPLGVYQIKRQLAEGLTLYRITCPLGVLGVIFEARPEALIQITSLAIKSGNAVILKGGKEATNSCQILTEIIKKALGNTQVNPDVVQLLTTREEIRTLLTLEKYIDLIIPRGSNEFVRYIQSNTKIPVLGHADGICHLYVDAQADLEQAINITVEAKTQYPSACNTIETLLVHEAIAPQFLPLVADALTQHRVTLKGDNLTRQYLDIEPATEIDWRTEYSDLILSLKIVNSLGEAIEHINTYGSKHTDAIITQDQEVAQIFLNQVDSAGVYHNCSTRFADGFRYGFGAEVGISTQKMPPRGPVGLEGLVTYKYQLIGNGHLVANYTPPKI